MDDEPFSSTLAYTKSPKTSRRTTFQDELEAAVSARANRHQAPHDVDDDEDSGKDDDDVFNELLKIQKQRKERFKAGKTKGKINDFKLSDDEEENVKPKKVTFMKTKRKSSVVQDEQLTSSNTRESADSYSSFSSNQSKNTPQSLSNTLTEEKNQPDSTFSSQSETHQPASTLHSEVVSKMKSQTDSSVMRKSLSESPLPLNSENSQWESPILLPSEGSQWDSPLTLALDKGEENQRSFCGEDGEPPIPHPRERNVKAKICTDDFAEDECPRPKPRLRTVEEKTHTETPASSRAATSSVSIALSNMSSSEKSHTFTSDSVQGTDECQAMSADSWTQPSSMAEQMSEMPITTSSVAVSEGKNSMFSEEKCSLENHVGLHDSLVNTSYRQSQIMSRSTDRPPSSQSSRKSKHISKTAESKYLGTLKILDQKMQENQEIPEAADSLRAAVYQEWLRKKQEKLQITVRAKKQEEKLKEKKREEEKLAKLADAKASYEAWKEKKAEAIKKQIKEKQTAINTQQKEIDEKQERTDTAKQVFEKWKQEHDEILKEKMRKQKETQKQLKLKQIQQKEEREKDCISAFTQWSEQKYVVIEDKIRTERRSEKIKGVEEKYEKEEREKMALEIYDKWLRRKEFQQKRERKEKRIQAILQDEPPPPWSPPNKTIPFGK